MKKFIVLLLIIGVTIGLSGCSFFGTPSSKTSQAEKQTITMWGLFESEEAMKPIIEDYQRNKQNQQINIEVKYIKKNYSDYAEETVNALAAGKGPDIWMIRNDWLPRQYDKLISVPENVMTVDQYKTKFPQVAINDNVIDGKIYGIPWSIDTLVLYYNTDIFDKKEKEFRKNNDVRADKLKNPPDNWNQLVEQVKLLTEKEGNNIKISAIALGTTNNVDSSESIISALMLQNNTEMVSADKKTATFNLPVTKSSGELYYSGSKALEFYTSFANSSSENYSWNNSMPNSVEAFAQSKAAMIIDYGYLKQQLYNMAPTLKYDIAPLPQIENTTTAVDYSSYWVEAVTNNSKNSDLAWDFINYVLQKKVSQYSQATKLPLPFAPEAKEVPPVDKRVSKKNSTFVFQLASAKDWYKGQYPQKVDEIFKQMINNIIAGQSTQSALDAAATNVTTLLNKSN